VTSVHRPLGQTGGLALKVFLVEDSPLLRERLQVVLASIPGAQNVGHAGRVNDAIEAILASKPDLVVLDIQLEDGSGFDVMRAVRASMPQVRFYVLTNFANEAYRRKAEGLGARGFFDKSNEINRLREAIVGIV
jgi:DNA-binding NarL/FixJ family response regulator